MNSDETAKLFYYGEITQNTNEDWKNVNLSLSTTTPSFNSKPPELSGVTVRFKPKVELPHPLVLEFKTQKEGIVKAREILTGPEVEVVNPNLKIAEITDKKASLGMKLWLAKGYGWVSADEKSREGREEGTIIIDSIFNPVFKVAPQIENVRVGKRNDYEKLSLVIETDSTLSPLEAFLKAVDLLAEEFTFLKKGGEKLLGVKKETTKKIKKKVVKTKKEK